MWLSASTNRSSCFQQTDFSQSRRPAQEKRTNEMMEYLQSTAKYASQELIDSIIRGPRVWTGFSQETRWDRQNQRTGG
jgi:hypothetical protein